jgi:rubrerythrin
MSDKPSYLGLLNAVALAEGNAHCYLTEWAGVTKDQDVRKILLTVAAREGEHAASFTKRINELGYELRQKPDESLDEKLDIVRSDCSDLEKMEALGLQRLDSSDGPDLFDDFFKDHTIDIRTGELLGRYIAEERDTGRLLRGCYGCLRDAADAEAAQAASNGAGKQDAKAARAMAKQITALDAKVDTLCRSIEELRQVVCAQTMPVS